MEDVYILGISHDYIPPSSSFSMKAYNFDFQVEKNIESITKISVITNGNMEEIFTSLDKYYAVAHLSIDIRIDYVCIDNNMNFHIVNFNNLLYINLGEKLNKKDFYVDAKILDCSVINAKNKDVNVSALALACLY